MALGVGFALQDVNGTNFWGGKTYTRDAGAYVSRKDHGRIELLPASPDEPDTRQLRWLGPDGQPLLTNSGPPAARSWVSACGGWT